MAFYNSQLISHSDTFDFYENIVSKKFSVKELLYEKEKVKSSCYLKVKERYKVYDDNHNSLENISIPTGFSEVEKVALLNCYEGNTKDLKEMKSRIINAQKIHYRTKCVYCGIGDANTFDHYLPKNIFYDYSVYCHNLIPCCSYCNTKKGELFLDERGVRKIFNPFFDNYEEALILKCTFICEAENFEYDIKVNDGVANPVWKNHLTCLNMIQRYKDEVPRILSTIISDLIIEFEMNEYEYESALKIMKRKLKKVEEKQSLNSLDAIIRREYIEHKLLFDIDYLKKLDSTFIV